MLRHLPFFEALADTGEDSTDWRSLSAGLYVLRFVDDWVRDGPAAVRRNRWGLHAVRLKAEAIAPGAPERTILGGIVELMATAEAVDVDVLAARLFAYGRALDLGGRYGIAADVFDTILGFCDPVEQADLAIDSNMRLSYAYRMLGRFDDAGAACAAAGEMAANVGDVVKVLRARVADANLALARGNLPAAAEILDNTIAAAADESLAEVRAIALHDRAAVAYWAGEFEDAVRLAYRALEGTRCPVARDRVLADLAAMFVQLGVRTAARDALLVLTATAQEQYTRWTATINLLELAAMDGAELLFEQHRRELGSVQLPVDLAGSYHYHVGQGCRMFGRVDAARHALQTALALATQHQLNQLRFEAEQALDDLHRGERIAARQAMEAPVSLAQVASGISDLRALAGAR